MWFENFNLSWLKKIVSKRTTTNAYASDNHQLSVANLFIAYCSEKKKKKNVLTNMGTIYMPYTIIYFMCNSSGELLGSCSENANK